MNRHKDGFDPLIGGNAVCIVVTAGSAPLTPAQKAFNTLIKQIETQREKLSAWEISLSNVQQKYHRELAPLIEQTTDITIEIVHRLDQVYDQKGLSKVERSHIADLIIDLAGPILAERADERLQAVCDKYQPIDPDPLDEAELARMKTLLAEMTGLDLGDDIDMSRSDDVLRYVQEHMAAQAAAEEAVRAAKAAHQAKRKKSTKQTAQAQKQQAEVQQLSQSIREVYRKLASALHPDREPDPVERMRKTMLMQRANQAYGKGNLFQLLELQLELEPIDQVTLNHLGEERLLRYNTILKEQLQALAAEINQVELNFRQRFGISPATRLSPATAPRLLVQEISATRQRIIMLKRDLADLRDVKAVKSWFRAMRR